MGKATAAIARARKRYAAGGALEKSDAGDFTQNDVFKQIARAVQQHYAPGPAPADQRGQNVTTATRSLPLPVSTPRRDRGDFAEDVRPAVWNSVPPTGQPTQASFPDIDERQLRAMDPIELLKLKMPENWPEVSEEERTANGKANARALLSVIPGPANIIAGEDALRSGATAGLDFSEGNYKGAALNSAMAALSAFGALTGMPTGKLAGNAASGASSRVNMFVPAEPSPLADIARALRKQPPQHFNRLGGQNQTIHKETGMFFGPDGVLRREIPDAGMRKTQRTWAHGDEAPLKDVVDHPDLFAQMPAKGEIPVRFEKLAPGKQPIARTSGETFQLSNEFKHKWLRNNIAKLLQYGASKEGNMAAPVRHDLDGTLKHIDNTLEALKSVPHPSALSYSTQLQKTKDDIARFMAESQGKSAGGWRHPWLRAKDIESNEILSPRDMRNTLARGVNARVAGNVEADIVKKRVTVPGGYPYTDAPDFAEQIVLPHRLDPENLEKFVRNWNDTGAGRAPQKFAQGGKVSGAVQRARQKLASGGLIGHTGGRSDELPVKAAEGSYVIPADVVSSLGEGNTMAGMKNLFGRFPGNLGKGVKKAHLATGGKVPGRGVDIIVSDGEFIVTPAEVAELGGGDLKYGHEILDAFVVNTRKQHIQTLASLPGPKQ